MKQNKHALREQAESWGDKVAVCWWYGQSYGVSSWWTTERRQHIPDRGQAKTRAETAEKTSVDHNEVVGFRWICIYLCFEVIRCDIAWYIAICRDITSHIMRYHKIRYIEILYVVSISRIFGTGYRDNVSPVSYTHLTLPTTPYV